MHHWTAHLANGMRIVRGECILGMLENAPLLVLSHHQGGIEYAYHYASGRFYRNDVEIGTCNTWHSRGGKPIAQRVYEATIPVSSNGTPHTSANSTLQYTRLGVQKDGAAQYLEIYADNTHKMVII